MSLALWHPEFLPGHGPGHCRAPEVTLLTHPGTKGAEDFHPHPLPWSALRGAPASSASTGPFALANLPRAHLSFLSPPSRSRVWVVEDVARTDLPQLRGGAERGDAAVPVALGQLRLRLQLQPHPVTRRQPRLGSDPAGPAPARAALRPPPPGGPTAGDVEMGPLWPPSQRKVQNWSSASLVPWLSPLFIEFLGGGGESLFHKNRIQNRMNSHLSKILWV